MSPPSRYSAGDRFLVAGIVFGAFTLVVLGSAGQDFLYDTMRSGRERSFWLTVRWPGLFWYGWAFLTPLALAVAKRYQLNGEHTWGKLVMLAVGGLALVGLHIALQVAFMELPFYRHLHPTLADAVSFHFLSSIHTNLITFALIAGAWHAGTYYHTLRQREVQRVRLESQLARAELESLRMQIQPHFLFNTLNGISEMMYHDVPTAERMLSNLSALLRTSIYREGDQLIRVEEEITFVRLYLEIQEMRFADRLHVTFRLDDEVTKALVPSFILQPFAENAIKHGVCKLSRPVHVRIQLFEHDGRLCIEVVDDGPGMVSASRSHLEDDFATGVGIANVRRRLDHLFGSSYRLDLDVAQDGFAVRMEIPLYYQHTSLSRRATT